ncbi:MAG: thiamine phosphate synthase, partial [Gammaproteobacteria bacterium]|nr:thiamine phosphate synthase [Gammaproteobacteria bacterium]
AACFIINDDYQLALEVDADGVHIGRDDGAIQRIKQKLGDKILGVSCYNSLNLAQQAASEGADYVAFGRFFISGTKPDAVAVDIALIRQAKAQLSLPVVGIGGITAENAHLLVSEGIDAVAVIGGLFHQADIKQSAQRINKLFTQ